MKRIQSTKQHVDNNIKIITNAFTENKEKLIFVYYYNFYYLGKSYRKMVQRCEK